VRQLRDHCATADVPFFFKQWGSWTPSGAGEEAGDGAMRRVTGKRAGRVLDGRTWDELPLLASARALTEGR
jgi:protein gp37